MEPRDSDATRTVVVTGSASGIGKATKTILESRGQRVVGVDLHDADIEVDLATSVGRRALVDGVDGKTGGAIDAVYAIAGRGDPTPATAAVNYFGMVATLEMLRPFLERSASPRAVAVSSMAGIFPADDDLVSLMLAGDEDAAMQRAEHLAAEPNTLGPLIYISSKRAMSQWIRRQAITSDWAGASIPLNAIAPGTIATPLSAPFTSNEKAAAALLKRMPMPLNGIAQPEAVAELLAWLGSEANTHLCGQVLYVDGGSDATIRGESVW